ncbi:DNA polymerase III subunit epsilon [Buchnera aphidicola (Rhopalosiphum padi)]|uniref:DNA polymerase III subunit epsilon n=1 Tax=Buchnera aphidicola subsp. Rhopalosiphum padi TaxID=98793 RepID=A0A4D6YE78_BUCRP|nr:DNA polymerase III subunit epsilon [Buchnera aphidicola]QCI24891.1 DNA polymerase III subunit epsilon [Buchnera aphidicola (Rhopalosiphum padi)]
MNNKKRIIVLDTETTGINSVGPPYLNHRIIEIGAIEIINRRFTGKKFHSYVKPNRLIESSALKIHGITDDFLLDKPSFKDIAKDFFNYIKNSELIIHNASFDVGFINQEFSMLSAKIQDISNFCSIIDTLKIARKLFPGKKNTLDALCLRYKIKNSHRILHGAILDAFLLGKLYLLMTSGQESILFDKNLENKKYFGNPQKSIIKENRSLKILKANKEELELHKEYLRCLKKTKEYIL